MENRKSYNVTIMLTQDGKGKAEALKGMITFAQNPDDYGNGYRMSVRMPDEAFASQGYDIRYDNEFDANDMISYIVRFYSQKYRGSRKGSWRLAGIRVHEAEEIEDER